MEIKNLLGDNVWVNANSAKIHLIIVLYVMMDCLGADPYLVTVWKGIMIIKELIMIVWNVPNFAWNGIYLY